MTKEIAEIVWKKWSTCKQPMCYPRSDNAGLRISMKPVDLKNEREAFNCLTCTRWYGGINGNI